MNGGRRTQTVHNKGPWQGQRKVSTVMQIQRIFVFNFDWSIVKASVHQSESAIHIPVSPLFCGFPLAELPGSSNSWIAPHRVSGWSEWSLRAGYPWKAIVLRPDRLWDRLYMSWLLGSKSFLRGRSGQPTPCPPWSVSRGSKWMERQDWEPGVQWVKLDSTQVLFCLLATRPYIDHCVQFSELYVRGLAFESHDTCPAFHPGALEAHQIVHCECRLPWQWFSTSFWRMFLLKGHFRMLGASLGLYKAPWMILIYLQRAPPPVWESWVQRNSEIWSYERRLREL